MVLFSVIENVVDEKSCTDLKINALFLLLISDYSGVTCDVCVTQLFEVINIVIDVELSEYFLV